MEPFRIHRWPLLPVAIRANLITLNGLRARQLLRARTHSELLLPSPPSPSAPAARVRWGGRQPWSVALHDTAGEWWVPTGSTLLRTCIGVQLSSGFYAHQP